MIESSEIKKFLHKYIAVGVHHDILADKLFFYFGTLKNVDNTEIKIEMENGFKIISIENIIDIHLVKNNYNEYYGGQ